MLTQFIIKTFSVWQTQVTISIIAFSLYLINKNIIKSKFLNRFRISELLLFSLPYFNICFLVLNVMAFYIKFYIFSDMISKPFKRTLKTMRKLVKTKRKRVPRQKVNA